MLKRILKYFFLLVAVSALSVHAQDKCDCPDDIKIREEAKNWEFSETAFNQFVNANSTSPCDLTRALGFIYKIKDAGKKLEILNKRKSNFTASCNKRILAEYYYLLGNVSYLNTINLDSTVSFYIRGLDYANQIHSRDLLMNIYEGLGSCYFDLEQPDKAIEYYKRSGSIALELKKYILASKVFGNAASAYGMKYDSKNETFCLDSALSLTSKSSVYAKLGGYEKQVQYNYATFSGVYMILKQYDKALRYCDSILMIKEVTDDNKAIVFSRKSQIKEETGSYKEALAFADSTYKYAVISLPPSEIIASLNRIALCYKNLNDYRNLSLTQDRIIRYKDSVSLSETNQKVSEFEKKYDQVKNEKTISELNQQKEIDRLKIISLFAFSALTLLVILVIVFFYRQSVTQNKIKIIEAEQRLNRARINPHFFFNALASLQSISMEENKAKEISEYIHRFSKIMRESLESTFHELNTIENEIEFLTHYLEIQRLHTGNKFSYCFHVDEKIETDGLMLPGMILQPFIENSIEHGFSRIKNGGTIDIHFLLYNDRLVVHVVDNGSGFKEGEKTKNYPSRAIQIIKDRLFLLNKQYKTKAIFEIKQEDNGGTKVEIYLPVIPKN